MKIPAWILIFMVAAFLFLRIGVGYLQRESCGLNTVAALISSVQDFGARPSTLECAGWKLASEDSPTPLETPVEPETPAERAYRQCDLVWGDDREDHDADGVSEYDECLGLAGIVPPND